MSEVISMPECRWVRTRLTQYLDRDPSAPLSNEELARLESHIAICEKCASISEDYREMSQALSQYRKNVDKESIERLSNSLKKLTSGE